MTRLDELKDQVRIKGFRPGKVPVAHLKRVYGRSVMAEMIEATVREANAKIVTDRGVKLAREPKVTLPKEQGAVEQVIDGKSRPRLHDGDRDPAADRARRFQDASARAARRRRHRRRGRRGASSASPSRAGRSPPRPRAPRPRTATASSISFIGKIDGEPFEGGSGDDVVVHDRLGHVHSRASRSSSSASAAGETAHRQGDLPGDYPAAESRRQGREFDVTVKAVEAPATVTIDDEFAKSLGLESLAKLRETVKEQHRRASTPRVAAEAQAPAARRARRPAQVRTAADAGRAGVRQRLEDGASTSCRAQKQTFEDEGTTEEEARADYRKIAERRVRLGLVLAEIGERNKIKVTDEEVQPRAWSSALRQFPGQEQAGLGLLPQESGGAGQRCGRRSSRRRWSTTSSNSPRSPTRRSRARSCCTRTTRTTKLV